MGKPFLAFRHLRAAFQRRAFVAPCFRSPSAQSNQTNGAPGLPDRSLVGHDATVLKLLLLCSSARPSSPSPHRNAEATWCEKYTRENKPTHHRRFCFVHPLQKALRVFTKHRSSGWCGNCGGAKQGHSSASLNKRVSCASYVCAGSSTYGANANASTCAQRTVVLRVCQFLVRTETSRARIRQASALQSAFSSASSSVFQRLQPWLSTR